MVPARVLDHQREPRDLVLDVVQHEAREPVQRLELAGLGQLLGLAREPQRRARAGATSRRGTRRPRSEYVLVGRASRDSHSSPTTLVARPAAARTPRPPCAWMAGAVLDRDRDQVEVLRAASRNTQRHARALQLAHQRVVGRRSTVGRPGGPCSRRNGAARRAARRPVVAQVDRDALGLEDGAHQRLDLPAHVLGPRGRRDARAHALPLAPVVVAVGVEVPVDEPLHRAVGARAQRQQQPAAADEQVERRGSRRASTRA